MTASSSSPATLSDVERRARRRVNMKMGFYTHALVFVCVNAGLWFVNAFMTGGEHRWSLYPLVGWGLGLAIHGVVTLIGLQGDGLRERMLRDEVERLKARG